MHSLTTASRCLLPFCSLSRVSRNSNSHRTSKAASKPATPSCGSPGDVATSGAYDRRHWSRCRLARRDTCDRTRGGMARRRGSTKDSKCIGAVSAAVLFSLLPWESCPPSQVVLCYTEWLNSSKARVGNSKLSDWLVAIAGNTHL